MLYFWQERSSFRGYEEVRSSPDRPTPHEKQYTGEQHANDTVNWRCNTAFFFLLFAICCSRWTTAFFFQHNNYRPRTLMLQESSCLTLQAAGCPRCTLDTRSAVLQPAHRPRTTSYRPPAISSDMIFELDDICMFWYDVKYLILYVGCSAVFFAETNDRSRLLATAGCSALWAVRD